MTTMKPGEADKLMQSNLSVLDVVEEGSSLALLSGFYKDRPAVHLVVVKPDPENPTGFLVLPVARMYSAHDMEYIAGPNNDKPEQARRAEEGEDVNSSSDNASE